ncbi:MAG TPA: SDR family oxidoreductase [Anaerolineae bacterium]|nr:SDR family oxidoreductase [Anaerolineae bacterium]
MKALVTGGTGFLGANLTKGLLEQGWSVRILRRTTSPLEAVKDLQVEHAIGDVTNVDSLVAAMQGVEVVFNVAAISQYWRNTPSSIYKVNVGGAQNVFDAAARSGVKRVVHTSSAAAVGIIKGRAANEDDPFNQPPDRFPYGHSKWLAEAIVRERVQAGQDIVMVNPAAIIGARDINWISGSILREAKRGHIPVIPQGGVNFVAVQDVVAGHIAAVEKGRAGERYILGGENLTNRQTTLMAYEIVGVKPPRITQPRWTIPIAGSVLDMIAKMVGPRLPLSGEQMRLTAEYIYFDSSKAQRELALPHTPVRQALQECYDWYVEHRYL